MKLRSNVLFAALLVLLFGAAAYAQDLTIHMQTTATGMPGGGKTMNSDTYISKAAIRNNSPEGMDSIVYPGSGKIVTIDNKKRTYTELTVDQLQEMLNKVTAEMNDPEKKQAMEQMRAMMGGMADSIKVENLGPGETVAGFRTHHYKFTMGPMVMDIMATPDLAYPPMYYDTMKLRMKANPMFDMGKIYEEMKKIKGVPLKTVMNMKMMGMSMTTTSVATSVDRAPIPASVFAIPAGYKAVPFKF